MFIGSMATTKRIASKMWFEQSFDTCAHYWFQTKNNKKGRFESTEDITITPIKDNDETLFYQVEHKTKHRVMANDIPIYNQLLENEWIKCFELRKQMGGELIEIKTDNITVSNATGIVDITTDVIGGYQQGSVSFVPVVYPKENINLILKFDDWNWLYEHDFENTDKIVDSLIESNKCWFVDGKAGFGKSYILKAIETKIKSKGLKCQVLASTNKASNHVGGTTIHKFLNIGFDGVMNNKSVNKLKALDFIRIDECAMVNSSILAMFNLAKIQNPNIKFIYFGHHWQLKPVGEEDMDFENSYVFKSLCDFNRFEMTINRRSNNDLLNITDYIHYNGKVSPDHIDSFGNFDPMESKLHICFTNRKRVAVNDSIMKSLVKENIDTLELPVEDDQLKINEKAQPLILTVGAPVQSIVSRMYNGHKIFNNQDFMVQSWDEEFVYLLADDGENLAVALDDFHLIFVVAYCMTVHRAQGSTFNFKYAIHESSLFSTEMLYTAVTRATDASLITFAGSVRTGTINKYSESFIKRKIIGYTSQDKIKHRKCDLSVATVKGLIQSEDDTCFSCATVLNESKFTLDRINNQIGHTLSNCRLCCQSCNHKKIQVA
jgi:hypothetical protein